MGGVGLDGALVSFEGTRPGGVGFGDIAPGIEGKDADRELVAENQVCNHLVFDAETGAEHRSICKLPGQPGQRSERTSVRARSQLRFKFKQGIF